LATILVVDDRPSNRQLLTTLLGYGGHRLLEAGNGVEALYQLHENRPDLLITDILMPTMDGYSLVLQLRADPDLSDMPVIFYSASYGAAEARALGELCGVRHVLPKPSEPERILAAVADALGLDESRPPPSPEARAGADAKPKPRGPAMALGSYLSELEDSGKIIDRLLARFNHAGGSLRSQAPLLPEQFAAQLLRLRRIGTLISAFIRLELDLAAQRDPALLLDRFFETASTVIDSHIAAVGMLDHDEKTLRHVRSRGINPELLRRGTQDSPFFGALLAGAGAIRRRTGQPVLPHEGLPAGHPPVENVMGVTVSSGNRACGWLYFAGRDRPEGFTADDERVAAMLAVKLGSHFENATQYDMIQRRATQLQIDATLRRNGLPAPPEAPTPPRQPTARGTPNDLLTRREMDVLKLVVDGKSNSEAGTILGLSPRSVETYRGRLMQKLGLHGLPALVKFAIRQGITPLD
jgi:DNA-binding NarL/FixJ family response regulator